MSLYYQDNDTTLWNGDCRNMDALEDGSVQMVVTSPPYWGLRKYAGVPDLVWGGDSGCEHEWTASTVRIDPGNHGGYGAAALAPEDRIRAGTGTFCQCGAWRGSYGLEPTPEMYVDHTIEVLREIRRVLRDDGVVFWNLGDCYAAGGNGVRDDKRWPKQAGNNNGDRIEHAKKNTPGLKPKDLVLIPFRVALAAQADGWWVRSVIIWDKANPMPESVRDRPTTSHEYIIMLTKNSRYYWDQEAVREPQTGNAHSRGDERSAAAYQEARESYHDFRSPSTVVPGGRNVRSVWSFPSQPYPDAHFATFPEALPERCIKAATPEVGCCEKCGAPWERVTSRRDKGWDGSKYGERAVDASGGLRSGGFEKSTLGSSGGKLVGLQETTGWQPTCKCWRYAPDAPIIDGVGFKEPYPKVLSVVLDPFAGSGTTLWVAKRLGRKSVGYELSADYCALAVERLRQQSLV